MLKRKLSKQDLFIKYFFDENSDTYMNATRAGMKAGYSRATAQNIFYKIKKSKGKEYQKIQKECEKRLNIVEKAMKETELTPEYVLSKLQAIAELYNNPDKLARYKNLNAVHRALELLGKYLKLFTERIEIEQRGVVFHLHFPDGVVYPQEVHQERPEIEKKSEKTGEVMV